MKKLFLYFTAISFVFFSCKSTNSLAKDLKNTSENLENVSKNLESTSKNLENTSKNLGVDSVNSDLNTKNALNADMDSKEGIASGANTENQLFENTSIQNDAENEEIAKNDSDLIDELEKIDDFDNIGDESRKTSAATVPTTDTNSKKNNSSTKFRPYAVFDEIFGNKEDKNSTKTAQNSEEDWKDDVPLSPFALVDEITTEDTENDTENEEIGDAVKVALADGNAEEISNLNPERRNAELPIMAQINLQDETENIASEIVLDQDVTDTEGERIIVKDGNAVISELLPFENVENENNALEDLQDTPEQLPIAQEQTPAENRTAIIEEAQPATQQTEQIPQTATNVPQMQPAEQQQEAQRQNQTAMQQPTQTVTNAQTVTNTTPIPTTPATAQQPVRQAQTANTQQTQIAQTAAPTANRTQENAPRQSSESYEQIITDGEQKNDEEFDGNTGIKPSRSVTVGLGAYLDIEYPGNGWIYIGEEENTENMLFFGRKLGSNITSFTLRSRKSGTTLLHFYKNDLLTGKYIDDYLEVVITETPVENSSAHVIAPAYAMVVPPRPSRTRDTSPAQISNTEQEKTSAVTEKKATPKTSGQINTPETEKPANTTARTAIQTPSQTPPQSQEQTTRQPQVTQTQPTEQTQSAVTEQNEMQAEEIQTAGKNAVQLLSDAKRLYDEKKFNDALKVLKSFFEIAESHIDEGLYLQGQILESNSEIRNIKEAIDSYGILINNWPDSKLWQEAQRRYIYLRRFYINIH